MVVIYFTKKKIPDNSFIMLGILGNTMFLSVIKRLRLWLLYLLIFYNYDDSSVVSIRSTLCACSAYQV